MRLSGNRQNLANLITCVWRCLQPLPRISAAQWSDDNLWLARGQTSEPGKYRTDRLPYQREPLEKASDPYAGGVVLLWGKQLGKTQVILNLLGWCIDAAPCDILVKYPSLDSAKKFSQKKLSRMIAANECLRKKIGGDRYRDAGNTILTKDFRGGSVTMIGANSASGLRQLSCRVVIQDEIDSDKANSEGDPVDQADGRADNYHDALFLKSSTPTMRGGSRIEALFEQSDKRYWHIKCPRCEQEQVLKWSGVEWPEGKPEEAIYRCEHCRGEWTDIERIRAILNGRWIATNPNGTTCGYHLSGLYRIMGKKRKFRSYLHQFAHDYLNAKGDRSKLMFWTNTFLAETFVDDSEKIDADPLHKRCEDYGPVLPEDVCLLTAAVDVQNNRLEGEVVGWGLGEESWGIEYFVIQGSPFHKEPWQELDALLQRRWEHSSGVKLAISILAIDSGGTQNNYAFTRPVYSWVGKKSQASRGRPGVVAVKGSSVSGAPLASQSLQKSGINLLLVGTDRAKATIYERLKLEHPGPGFMHFPRDYGPQYFKGLVAEELQTVIRKGFPVRVWVKVAQRNEPLDLRAYNLAALELLNPNWEALVKMVSKPKTEQNGNQQQQAARRKFLPFRRRT